MPSLARDVTIMGGAALAPDNRTPVAEANISNDPEAAGRVIGAGWEATIVPLDATMRQLFEQDDLDTLLASDSRLLRLHVRPPRFGAARPPRGRGVDPGEAVLSRVPRVRVQVDAGRGPRRGQLIADLRARPAETAALALTSITAAVCYQRAGYNARTDNKPQR